LAKLSEWVLKLSARRSLPKWRSDTFARTSANASRAPNASGREVVLLVDTFNSYFEPEVAHAARTLLEAAGYIVHLPQAAGEARPLCGGRTFLASGLTDEAKHEAQRTLKALKPFVDAGVPIVGLEPSCLFTLRDEFGSLLPGAETELLASKAMLLEEFIAAEVKAGRWRIEFRALPQKKALLHGHCHQKAFGAMGAVEQVLRLIPELMVETVASSCCGMAGAFGFEAEHYGVSMQMGELSLLPAVRKESKDTLLVADGTSCRHQILDGAQRDAVHVAVALARALPTTLTVRGEPVEP
jgi:Fe-S oxidoreductase